MTDAPAGWIIIGTATIWVGNGVRALIVSRRAAATPCRRKRAQKWQWLALAALQVVLGVWFITGPSAHPAVEWWLVAGFGALAAWMLITDVSPWLWSRLRRNSSHASS